MAEWNMTNAKLSDQEIATPNNTIEKMTPIKDHEIATLNNTLEKMMPIKDQEIATLNSTIEKMTPIKGYILIIGGYILGSLQTVNEYNVLTGTRTPRPDYPTPVNRHACTLYEGNVVVSGGYTGSRRTNQVYTLKNNRWIAMGTLNTARWGHAMVVHEGELDALGGVDSNMDDIRSVERYSASLGRWVEEEKGLNGKFYYGGAVAVN